MLRLAATFAVALAVQPTPTVSPRPASVEPVVVEPSPDPVIAEIAALVKPQLVAFFPCASAAWSPENPNHFSYGLEKPGGWQRFVDGHVTHAVETLGYERVMFHLPMGKATGNSPQEANRRETGIDDPMLEKWHMGLDAAHDLRATGFGWVVAECIAALDMFHMEHPHVEVIVYVGSADGQDRRRFDNGEYTLTFALWLESLAPFLDRDYISIVFDAAVGKEPDHPNARFAQLAQWVKKRQGRFVGVEARIQKARPWPNKLGMTTVAWADTWVRQGHALNIPREKLVATPIIVFDGHAKRRVLTEYGGEWRAFMADILGEGCNLGISTAGGEFQRVTAADLAYGLVEHLAEK